MSRNEKNRVRNQIISFRATEEEQLQINARITVSGMAKSEYFIQSLLHQKIVIAVGKYKSDRLSLELRKLREHLEQIKTGDEELLMECKALLEQMISISEENNYEILERSK